MTLEDLEREILKVAGQGGIARVSEDTVLEAMSAEEEEGRREEMAEWRKGVCEEYRLQTDQNKDIFGSVELLFFHGPEFHGHG